MGAERTLGESRQRMLGTDWRRRPRYPGGKRCGRTTDGSQIAERFDFFGKLRHCETDIYPLSSRRSRSLRSRTKLPTKVGGRNISVTPVQSRPVDHGLLAEGFPDLSRPRCLDDGLRTGSARRPTGSSSGSSAWFRLRVSYFGSTPDSRRRYGLLQIVGLCVVTHRSSVLLWEMR